MITVDNRFGSVTKVTSRYVVVRSLDGIEAIVPNETLVTTTVLNHSYSNRDVRLALPVQISYDSDLDLAMRLIEEIALRRAARPARAVAACRRWSCASPTAASISNSASGSTTRRTARATCGRA